MSTAPVRRYTAEDLLREEFADGHFELIEGELVEMSPNGPEHGATFSRLSDILYYQLASIPGKRGTVRIISAEMGLLVAKQPDTVLAPDMAIYDKKRDFVEITSFSQIPPDIAVEIVSPSNRHVEMLQKVVLYLQFGVKEVWVVNPRRRQIHVHTSEVDGERVYSAGDTIECNAPLDGISIPVLKVFED